ncbi:hemagglutinin repeat-containing protein, partial [Patescibacteria group bacterium]|nr:hemagglutinin repeat-containing protein [Patescibacteria group bacterium]
HASLPSGQYGIFVVNSELLESAITNSNNLETIDPISSVINNAIQTISSTGGENLNIMTTNPNPEVLNSSFPLISYLFETNQDLINSSSFLGSTYFLTRLGLDPNTLGSKFIGDAYYEQNIVKNALTKAGVNTITSSFDMNTKMQNLYDNAYIASITNGGNFTFGVALTATQIASLEQDMLWYVFRDITLNDGTIMKDILVPQVYFAQSTINELKKNYNYGSVIAGNDIMMNVGDALTNSGTIKATNTVNITANSLTNKGISANNTSIQNGIFSGILTNLNIAQDIDNTNGGIIQSDTALQMIAGRDINNIGSRITSDGTLLAQAGRDINNKTLVHTINIGEQIISTLGNIASISSKDTMNLIASNDITIAGATVDSKGSALVQAGNNINLESVAVRNRQVARWSGKNSGHSITDTTKNYGSDLNVAGNLVMSSGNDTNIKGSDVNVGGDASVQTGGDLSILSVQDTYYHSYANKKKRRFGRSKSSSTEINSITNVSSNINVGGDLTTNSDKNLTILASNVSADGDISLQADGNVNILSGQDMYSIEKKSSKSGWNYAKSSETTTEDTTVVSSNVNAGNNLNIVSGKDTNLLASNITAQNDINVTTGDDFNAMAGANTHYFKHTSQKLKSGFFADSGNGSAEAGSSIKFEKNKLKEASTDVVEANILAKNNININSNDNASFIATNVIANDGSIDVRAKNNLNILTKEQMQESEQSKLIIEAGVKVSADASGLLDSIDSLKALGDVDMGGMVSGITDTMDLLINGDGIDEALSGNEDAINDVSKTVKGMQALNNGPGGVSADASVFGKIDYSTSESKATQEQGSLFYAGKDIDLNAENGDLKIRGAEIIAKNDINLSAGNDVIIEASQNTQTSKSKDISG